MTEIPLDRIVGHRGLASHAPENTLASIELAARIGLPAVEFDIQATRDGQFVLMHDETVDRTTNGSGAVEDLTLAQLQALDAAAEWRKGAPGGPTHIPTLREALLAAPGKLPDRHVEVKFSEGRCASFAEALRRALTEASCALNVTISSFSPSVLEALREENLPVEFALLTWDDLSGSLQYCAERGIGSVHARWDLLDKAYLKVASEEGIVVRAYTVNEQAVASRLLSMGVAQIISDTAFRGAAAS